jgi:hypothetical protein
MYFGTGLAILSSGTAIHKEANVAINKKSGRPAKQLKKAKKIETVKPLTRKAGGTALPY